MARMTRDLRYKLIRAGVNWKFKAEKAAVAKEENALAKALLDHFYPPASPIRTAIASLPEGVWLKTINQFELQQVQLERLGVVVPEGFGVWVYFDFGELVKMFRDDVEDSMVETSPLPAQLRKRLTKFLAAKKKLNNRRSEFKDILSDLLNRISSTKALLEIYPEAKEWVTECTDIPAGDDVCKLRQI